MKKIIIGFFIIMILLTASLPDLAKACDSDFRYTTTRLNLRDTPNGKIRTVLPSNCVVLVDQKNGKWVLVSAIDSNLSEGWVYSDYLAKSDCLLPLPTISGLNLRKGPGKDYDVILVLRFGDVNLHTTGKKQGEWLEVLVSYYEECRVGNVVGWVHKSLVK